jgi:Ca-activated chloride channel homolog
MKIVRGSIIPILILAVVLPAIPASFAQSGRRPSNSGQGQDEKIRLRADEVLLNVTVTDSYGRQVTDLTKSDFIVSEDNDRQEIASFAISTVPVNVVMLLDASGSVVGEISSLRNAATHFVDQLRPEDKVSVIEFHTKVELIQDWTSNADDVKHAISWRFRPGMVRLEDGKTTYGSTALYDALYLTTQDQLSKVEGRKAIIVLTDGDDTSSKVTYGQSLASAIRSGAVVYVVSKAQALIAGLKGYTGKLGRVLGGGNAQVADYYIARLERAEEVMTDLTKRTGGLLVSPLNDDDLKEVYGAVARELKDQYIVSYVPKNEKRDGGLRRIGVYLTRPGLRARSRDSYYAPKD